MLDLILVVQLTNLISTLAGGGGVPIRDLVLNVIAMAWLTSLGRAIVKLWQSKVVYKIWESLSQSLLSKLLYQSYTFYLCQDRNSLSTRLQIQLSQLRNNIIKPLIEATSSGITTLLFAFGLLWLTGGGSLLAFLIVLSGYGLQVLQIKPILRRQKEKIIHAELESNNIIIDTFGNIRRMLLEGGQTAILRRKKELDKTISLNSSWSSVLPHLPRQLVEPLGLTVVLLFLLVPSIRSNGNDALPWLAIVTLGLLRLSQPMQKLSESYTRLLAGIPLLHNLLPLIEMPINVPPKLQDQPFLWRKMQLVEVSFKYPGMVEQALKDVNLNLQRGELVAIVGASGSGKSTLSSILTGLISPDKGSILIDNEPLLPDRAYTWQRKCSEVSQPPKLIKGSVRTNLAGWSEPAPDAEIWEALEQVGLKKLVKQLPRGLESLLGDQGQGLSGGEQQRLAIAAAILRKSGLIILDEATSGVQEALAENLIPSLKNQPQKPAVVVITHRETIMRCCDRVLVIKQGKIVADGAFNELKNNCSELRALLAKTSKHQAFINTDC